jgi:HrpA-like RNA helicase
VLQQLAHMDEDKVDGKLIVALVRHICTEVSADSGEAILVFLPGWADITEVHELLRSDGTTSQDCELIALHSMIAGVDQQRAFAPPPKGKRKVILATSIAETSITIDDVVYVIDSGKSKEKTYHPLRLVDEE